MGRETNIGVICNCITKNATLSMIPAWLVKEQGGGLHLFMFLSAPFPVKIGARLAQAAVSHLSQQFEHFCRLLRLALPQKPLDLPDPRHASHVRAVVAPPQHPWKLV